MNRRPCTCTLPKLIGFLLAFSAAGMLIEALRQ